MKAIVYRQYGSASVLELTDVAKPSPGDNEVLVKIFATTVTSGDYRARSLDMPPGFGIIGRLVFGIFGPRRAILGTEFSGEIESVGKDVRLFSAGDQVFAYPGAAFGGYAQYATMAEDQAISLKPENVTHDEAAAISFGGATALDFLRDKGGIRSGDKVLISGASGSVGSAAVQLAKYFGAEVTGVCSSANLDLVKSIGADKVIDYTKENFASNGETYDIILDTTGTVSYARCEKSLRKNGRFLMVSADLCQMLQMAITPKRNGKKGIAGYSAERAEDLRFLARLAETGSFRPVVDRHYSLERIAEAHAYVEKGHKRGNVVVTVGHDDSLRQDRRVAEE